MPRPWTFRRTVRPIGVLTVSTWEAMNQTTGRTSRSFLLPVPKGSWPGCLPDSQVWWSPDSSRAISVPELAAPTTRTPPSCSWDGSRYRLECSCTIPGSSSGAKVGIMGRW